MSERTIVINIETHLGNILYQMIQAIQREMPTVIKEIIEL